MKKILNSRMEMLSKEWIPELFKYVVSGSIAFVLDFCILMLLYKFLGAHYLIASAIGLSIGLLTTYLLSIKWVFNNRALSNKTAELSLFLVIGSIGFLINWCAMWISVEKILLNVPISKIVATGIVFSWNFTARKIILFSGPVAAKE